MRVGFRTLKRTVCALVIVLMLVAGAGVEALAHGKGKQRGRRGDQGRHLGWERGRHRGWEHSRSRHVRDNDWWDDRRDRRRERRRERRRFRRSAADLNGDGFVSSYERRVFAARLRRGIL